MSNQSLATVHTPLLEQHRRATASVSTNAEVPQAPAPFSFWNLLKFLGPGFMIGVGYLDPGNWASDLAAGSKFGYTLLYILLIANSMATVLQYLCIKLGVVTGNDLAMSCRKHFSPRFNLFLYVLTQLAIISTDLAEVIGTAIALNLLFSIPLAFGVALTSLDVLVILMFYGKKHLLKYEAAVVGLVGIVGCCFLYLVTVTKPRWLEVAWGFVPSSGIVREDGQLYIAMAIMGAIIMPHNLYLHSSIVRYRSNVGAEQLGEIKEPGQDFSIENVQPISRMSLIPESLRYTNIDSIVALTVALLINSAILIVASAAFHEAGLGEVAELKDAYELLKQNLGPLAGFAFALALFCSGQSSTITGTLAGQVVTEGFLGSSVQFRPELQRLMTRLLAIVPAMTAALVSGESGMNQLIVLSQVVLSLQLPFAIWPLVWITGGGSDGEAMKVRFTKTSLEDGGDQVEHVVDYANSKSLRLVSFFIAVVITFFNFVLLWQMLGA
ncbi:natural resistance-associated macrophage protein-domain-containing protein [Obelidium mucronatum]|nr:natural resistance-associated macrophage protein-domain-containing protein [Obelidium mucronatum]